MKMSCSDHMKILTGLLVGLLVQNSLFSISKRNFDEQYKLLQKKDYKDVEKYLDANKEALARDPDYYVILLNYAFQKGTETGLVVAKGKAKKGDLVLSDPETKKEEGYIGERTYTMDKTLILDSIRATQKALPDFRDRLDIHFGIVAISGKIEEWGIVATQLISVIEISKENKNRWRWGFVNSMNGEPKEFMFNNIAYRCSDLFEINTPDSMKAFKDISEAMIKYYPDIILGWANMGTYYLANNDLDKAGEYYNIAIKIDPKDEIVLHNLEYLKKQKQKK